MQKYSKREVGREKRSDIEYVDSEREIVTHSETEGKECEKGVQKA